MKRSHYRGPESEEWAKQRMRALVRDDFRCQAHRLGLSPQECSETRLGQLIVHHIIRRIEGGTDDLENLITVCREHHAQIHPYMRFELEMKEKRLVGSPRREL